MVQRRSSSSKSSKSSGRKSGGSTRRGKDKDKEDKPSRSRSGGRKSGSRSGGKSSSKSSSKSNGKSGGKGRKGDWYSRGSKGHEQEKERRKTEFNSGEFDPRKINRYFIGAKNLGEPHEVLFLDTDAFNVWMHHYKKDGRWGHWDSCPRLNGEISTWCPLCDRSDNVTKQYLGHYTIIDVTGWDSDNGHRMYVKILPAKSELVAKLERRAEKFRDKGHDGLVGALFTVVRDKKDSDNCGNDWEYEEHVDLDEFLADNIESLAGSLDWYPDGQFWTGEGDDREYFLTREVEDDGETFTLALDFLDLLEPMEAEELDAIAHGAARAPDEHSDADDVNSDEDDPGY